ncbi:MAG: TIGR02117 family protein [Pseudomonadota bacterium]
MAQIVLLSLTIAGCSGKPYVVEPALQSSEIGRSHPVYVVNHGWHTGLVIPATYLNKVIPELKERFANTAYYEIGWGDKGFYQAQEITTILTLQTMFWSEGAIIHVVAVPGSPSEYFPRSEVIGTCLTDEQIFSLSTYVSTSFAHDPQRRIIILRPGIYGDSQFYDGEGRFYLLNTCNKWTAKGLQSGGLDIVPAFSLTAESVMSAMRAQRRQCTVEHFE